jgi:hypothetical protein
MIEIRARIDDGKFVAPVFFLHVVISRLSVRETIAQRCAPHAILDGVAAAIAGGCMENPVGSTRLHEFFLSMARKSFAELGVEDQDVVGYVAALMTEFARADRLYALQGARGRAMDSVAHMVQHAPGKPSDERSLVQARAMRKYVGDYTLFMSGLFRTHVEQRGALDYYLAEGRRSYWVVSELDLSLYRHGFLLFQQLSKNFEYYSGALDYMRKAYLTPGTAESPFARFLKQVEGWISSGLSDN